MEAAFVENDDGAFRELDRSLKERAGTVKTVARYREFGSFIPELRT